MNNAFFHIELGSVARGSSGWKVLVSSYSSLESVDPPFFHNGDFSSLDSRLEKRWSVRALRRIDP